MPTTLEIAQKSHPVLITEVAKQASLRHEELELFGLYKAKVSLEVLNRLRERPDGKLILVTAITPTKQGEGKTCTSIGLTQALGRLGKKVIVCIRQPSLGPMFGMKGGGTGGGYAQLVPMEEINFHFTGDHHAIEYAHNLLAAIIDNHLYHGNALKIDPERLQWRRVTDVPDRALREITTEVHQGEKRLHRRSGYDITASSEIMAVLALSRDLKDLARRVGQIVVGYTTDGKPITVSDLKLQGALTLLLEGALRPNLVQTLEGQPAFVHTGPYANIAHGNSSIIATQMALKLANYAVTECGFGSDLGLEKFVDIVSREPKFKVDCVVLVCSVKALRSHGISKDPMIALREGFSNLLRHLENIKKFGLVPVVCINRFPDDTQSELQELLSLCRLQGIRSSVSEAFAKGSQGATELAELVLSVLQEGKSRMQPLYSLESSIEEKIERIAKDLYGAKKIQYSPEAKTQSEELTRLGFGHLPINMAKSHLSLTDDPKIKGVPKEWTFHVRELRLANGAGFIICLSGHILLLPGLPEEPIAQRITVDEEGKPGGFF